MTRRPGSAQPIRIVWGAILGSVLMYGIVAWAVAGAPEIASPDSFVVGLYLAGGAICVLSFFLPRFISPAEAATSSDTSNGVMRASIIQWAMLEAAAVLGLVAGLLRENSFFYFPMGAVAFLGILLSRPISDDSRF